MSDDCKRVESHDCPMSTCATPAGSPCRTGKGRVAIEYHTARFRLVPQLSKALSVRTPAVRKAGSVWAELPRPANAGAEPVGHVRLGYAPCLDRPAVPGRAARLPRQGWGDPRLFGEVSTRATRRPEPEGAVKLAWEIRSSGVAVTLVVHEHKQPGRGIELAMLAEELKASDVGLEFLTGELKAPAWSSQRIGAGTIGVKTYAAMALMKSCAVQGTRATPMRGRYRRASVVQLMRPTPRMTGLISA